MTDLFRLLDRLEPPQDGESPVRHRTGTVNAVNSDGTVDLDLGGIVVDSVAVLAGAFIAVGATVQVAVWRGDLLVLGAVRTANQGGPLGVLGYAEVTASQTGITSETDLTGLSVTVDVPAGRRIRISYQGIHRTDTVDTRVLARIKESTTGLQQVYSHHSEAGGGGQQSSCGAVVLTPSSGSHTYKMTMQGLGTATVELIAVATAPAFILVEDLGAA